MESRCDLCNHYIYDEESDSYFCNVDLDEDEYEHFVYGHCKECPYFDDDDEYKIVRHQM